MEILKFDIKIPFWCSFKEFGTVSSNLTYSFPPPPTLFGMILNAMGKLALHCINNEEVKKKLEKEYIRAFENLEFAIVVREVGEKIDDYSNVLKRNRGVDEVERHMEGILLYFIKKVLNKEPPKKICKNLSKHKIYKNNEYENILKEIDECELNLKEKAQVLTFLEKKWTEAYKYAIPKFWQKTQVIRQRIIKPQYTIFLLSTNEDEYSLQNIYSYLKNPLRPLYCGESDDITDVEIHPLIKLPNAIKSNQIASVIPTICSNSQIVNIPVVLRNQKTDQPRKVCSIPNGQIDDFIECYNIEGENIVFL